ncbi:ATP-dependent DNA helicase 2 subunit 2 [Marchantia polymorpha subsp. ruderalis]|uniref:ATP-dependent DNA helicase 2 subunit KU80 n=1 Tax=Marchantia polymorpha TaxID=3197 RepID=A0A2R6W8C8_MARPO|nr:hypothetical protein MARPO_0129s0012 [Marchantia polymorpha]BBN01731.1 hypothetical protein Mp_2g09860 [Marchantia polymorpha subsp. ruderalis]|eukprot:PTQ30118.1 hypothetical protein MARPO_0129s0012 [Marchantia polymorpha]
MARNKETLILLVDIGPSMHPHLDYAARAISALVQRKIVHNKHDEVGLVFFGANDTDNELSSELGGYEDIVVLRPIAVVSEELAQAVDQFSKEYGTSDFMDAMVVAMDLIVKKCAAGSKGNKRIYLITDGESPVKEPEEGTKSEQVELLRNQLQMHNIILDAVVIRLKGENGALESKASQENEFLLRSFADGTMGDLVLVESYTTLLGAVKSRSVSPTTLYRGDLELTPNMSIKVWVYKKVSSERMPTLRIYSDKAPLLDTTATHEVKFDIEYKSSVDLDVSIAPEQRIKAYKYGPQYVPISSKEEEALKFRTEKGLKVVGFTDKSNVPRHYFMKETNVFVPELRNTRSTLAISCLARAMEAEGKVAIVRCVWRAGQANVALGVLTPCLGSDDSVADCFYFNNIPFSEDLREFAFASFKDRPSTQQPTRLQQEAADALVQMMDLVPYPGQEFLMPERTVNPVLQTFKEQFQLIRSTQTEKGGRKFWKDRLGENEAALPGEDLLQIEDGKPLTFEFLTGKKVEQVGSLNPVEDFEALLARRDSDQWVTKAIKGMKKIITDLLNSAYNGNTYEKAVTCLIALRRGCVIQEEPSDFNTFLEEISNRCRGKRQNDFWELVTAKNLTLISKDETPDSDVTQEEAASFLSRVQNSGHVSEGVPEEEVDEIEALLDDVI